MTFIDIFTGVIKESYILLNKMSPYLLFGFTFAGLLHIFFRPETVAKHLGKNNISSVIKAALFGIPLPLCSCGVIPAAMSLRKEGASKGAVLSFLISTPTSGVDSIAATYALLGGIFTIYRILASFVTGVISGLLANLLLKKEEPVKKEEAPKCKMCEAEEHKEHEHGIIDKIKGMFHYAFVDLIKDSGGALLLGILIGGVITFFMPEEFIRTYLGSGFKAMVAMLIIGIPMYVCATASIPIAAALMLKGMNPGAAFVFLVAGPATNIVTMMIISKNMGKKALAIYLSSIAVCSVLLGYLLDGVWKFFQPEELKYVIHEKMLFPGWLGVVSSIVLIVLVAYSFLQKKSSMDH